MQDIYYVQPYARALLCCLHTKEYAHLPVHPKYLNGLDEPRFWGAFGELRDIFADFYAQAVAHPENISMPLYRMDEYDWKSREAKAGHTALLSFPITLFALAGASAWKNNTLVINLARFQEAVKAMRGSKTAEQMNRLCDYGFAFSEWDGKKFPTQCEAFTIDYPDNPHMPAVIAAIGDKFLQYRRFQEANNEKILHSHSNLGNFEHFVQFNPHLYADDSGALPPKTLHHMMNAVGEVNARVLCTIVEKFKERGLALQFGVCFAENKFYDKKGKDTLNSIGFGHYSMGVQVHEPLKLRLKLIRPSQYIEKIDALSPHLKTRFENVKCQNCNEKCTRKIRYALNNKKKIACACETFVFTDFTAKDLDALMALYDAEQEIRG